MSELILEKNNALPKGWTICKIEDLVLAINSGFPSGKHNKSSIGVPHIRPMNIDWNGNIDLNELKFVEADSYDSLKKGDILFNNTNSPKLLGKTTYIRNDTNWAYSNHMTRIRVNNSLIDPGWISYYLHKLLWDGFYKIICTNHVNQASINSTYLSKQVPIVLAPFEEQKKVVIKIDELFSKIDSIIESINKCVKLVNILGNSFVVSSLKGEVDELSKRITKNEIWQTKTLRDLTIESKNGYTGRPKDEPPGIRRLYIVSVTSNNSIYVNEEIHKFIEIPKSEIANYLVEKNDLLICRQNGNKISVGKFSISRGKISPMIFSDSLIRFRVDQKEILPEYLALYMNSTIGRKLIDPYCSTTAGNYSINSTSLKQIPITYPSINSQKLITMFVLENLTVLENLKTALVKYSEICHLLKKKIMNYAFEGKLVPQDPNNESAEILLQKIKQDKEKQKVIKDNLIKSRRIKNAK